MANKVSFLIQFKNQFGRTSDALNRQLVKIERNAGLANKRMQKFEKSVENTRKAAGRLARTGAVITAGVTAPIVFLGKKMVDAASEATETANKFNQVFDTVEGKANQVADSFSKSFGVAGSTARQMIGDTGDLLVGFGFTGDAALKMSSQVAELASDLTSFQNFAGGARDANVALTKALLGESEAAKALGIVVRQGTPEFKKNVKIIMRSQRVNLLQAKAIEILRIATSQSQKAIGDVSRTWEDYASVVRRNQEATKELKESFGRLLIPIATKLTSKLIVLVKWFTNLSPGIKKIILVMAGVAAVVGPIILAFGALAFSITSIAAVLPILGAMAVAVGAVSFPVLAVVAAIASIGAILFLVWKNWKSIVANMKRTINALLTPISKLSQFFGFDEIKLKTIEEVQINSAGVAAPSSPSQGAGGSVSGNIVVSAEGGAQVRSTKMKSTGPGLDIGLNMAPAGA